MDTHLAAAATAAVCGGQHRIRQQRKVDPMFWEASSNLRSSRHFISSLRSPRASRRRRPCASRTPSGSQSTSAASRDVRRRHPRHRADGRRDGAPRGRRRAPCDAPRLPQQLSDRAQGSHRVRRLRRAAPARRRRGQKIQRLQEPVGRRVRAVHDAHGPALLRPPRPDVPILLRPPGLDPGLDVQGDRAPVAPLGALPPAVRRRRVPPSDRAPPRIRPRARLDGPLDARAPRRRGEGGGLARRAHQPRRRDGPPPAARRRRRRRASRRRGRLPTSSRSTSCCRSSPPPPPPRTARPRW